MGSFLHKSLFVERGDCVVLTRNHFRCKNNFVLATSHEHGANSFFLYIFFHYTNVQDGLQPERNIFEIQNLKLPRRRGKI